MDILRTGARRRMRPSTRMAMPSRRSALKTIAQTAPMTIINPDAIQVEKFIDSGPRASSQ